jgi:hypothetical protein
LATRVDVRRVYLPDGARIRIPRWTVRFPTAEPDRVLGDVLPRTYTTKPLVDVDGEPLFGELAIVRWLQKDGWDAIWIDSYHDRGQHKSFWQGLPGRSAPYDLTQAPRAWEMYKRIVQANGGRAAGFFDVLAWQGERLLFVEYKAAGDRPKDNELSWLQAARNADVEEHQLLYIVHP